MDLTISTVQCGNRNCIGVIGRPYPQIPKAQIVIEDTWDVSESEIENSIVGLISHETVEYLLIKLEPRLLSDLHAILGHGQENKDYVGNTDGIVLGKCGLIGRRIKRNETKTKKVCPISMSGNYM